ncbi:hypothetical protein [Jeotgalibacillus aurantiacus]|nr:hypothetical protein [Jeotgalibacillus aurantiacus]
MNAPNSLDQSKTNGYKFLISMNRLTIDDVPEPYKGWINAGY